MTAAPSTAHRASAAVPTIWGLTPIQVHDRFWASRGVQVVRPGEPSDLVEAAELFLLLDAHSLVVFRLRDLVELLSWLDPHLLVVLLVEEGQVSDLVPNRPPFGRGRSGPFVLGPIGQQRSELVVLRIPTRGAVVLLADMFL